MQPDITVLNSSGEPILAVEVKSKSGSSKLWAAEFRRNLAAHGSFPSARFFLLATPDRLYLWKRPPSAAKAVEPSYIVEPDAISASFADSRRHKTAPHSPHEFEFEIARWLNELVHNGERGSLNPAARRWLFESGLSDAIRGGRVVLEAGG